MSAEIRNTGGEEPPRPGGEDGDCEKQTQFWEAETIGVQGAEGSGEGDLAGHFCFRRISCFLCREVGFR